MPNEPSGSVRSQKTNNFGDFLRGAEAAQRRIIHDFLLGFFGNFGNHLAVIVSPGRRALTRIFIYPPGDEGHYTWYLALNNR